jgi:ABC-type glycerol-3-phosphate transport system permease component
MRNNQDKKEISNQYSELMSMQKAKRGDLWLLLSILIPISILPAEISYNGSKSSIFVIQWLLFSLDLTNFRFLTNVSITWLNINPLPSIPIPTVGKIGNPLYNLFVLFQFFAIILALVFRYKQYLDSKNKKIVNSGVIGLAAFVIIFFEILKFAVARYQLLEIFKNYNELSWDTTGVSVSNPIISSIMSLVNSLFGQTSVYATNLMIPIIPIPIITNILQLIGISVDYPITFYLEILSMPFGLIITVLWMMQEYRAFPSAFVSWVTGFMRFVVIITFSIISVFPLLWIILITINKNELLISAGAKIWPFNNSSFEEGFTLHAWDAFTRFNYTIDPSTAFLFVLLSIVMFLIGFSLIFRRKSISNRFEMFTKGKIRQRVEELAWFSVLLIEIIAIIILRNFIIEIRKSITIDENSNSIQVNLIKMLIDTLTQNIGSILVIIIAVGIFLILLISIASAVVTRGKNWILFKSHRYLEKLFSLLFLIVFLYFIISIILLNLFSQGYEGITFANQYNFFNIFWFDIGFVLFSIVFLSLTIPKYKTKWFNWLESVFYEDGVAYAIILFFVSLGVIFAILADQGFDWIYFQAGTGKSYAIGNWFFVTFFICTIVAVLSIILASFSGYALSRYNFEGRKMIGSMILSTQIFPGVMLVLPVYIMLSSMGLTGSLLGLGIAYSITSLPFVTYLLKGFFDSIPKDLEEQAMIDGCNRFQAYHKIVLPLVLPGITSTFIFSFLAMYTEYLFALIIYNPLKTEEYTIALAMLKVFQADLTQRGVYFNEMAVFALLVTLPILLLFSYLQKYLMQGLVSGGTKG